MMQPSEHEEQCALMQWWALARCRFGVAEHLLFAIPNGGLRNSIVSARMKAEGVRAGVPDLFLAVPRGGYAGLFIEMKKRKGGVFSDAQKAMMADLAVQGFRVVGCHGWCEAKAEILSYLELGK